MSNRSDTLAVRFIAVRQALIDAGALPPNALQMACPDVADAVIPSLLRTGADAEAITLALADAFALPVYAESLHGLLNYAPDESWAWSEGWLFVADPFACQHLIRNPQLALPEDVLEHYHGKVGLLPLQTTTAEGANDPSTSPEAERLLHEWIALAVDQKASDLHIAPRDNDCVEIRIRRDGMLTTLRQERMTMSDKCNYRLVSNTLLTLSGNQHGVYNTPKDGNMEVVIRGRMFFIRVNMCPTSIGRRIWGSFTLRIVGGYQRTVPSLEQLSLSGDFIATLRHGAAMNHGLLLLTGPTGSGKTTTFYAIIMEILKRNRNQISIKTLEDPIEVQIPGIDQIQINNDLGMSYAQGLRALLRADPDVILIGEIRDEETAQLACRASLTGHLVLSTLHTRNSLGAIERLRNFGIPSALIADTLTLVCAQRLARRVCAHCVQHKRDDDSREVSQLLHLPDNKLWPTAHPDGCPQCEHRGYRGRICISEALNINAQLAELIAEGANLQNLHKAACASGFRDLWTHATTLVRSGHTTWAECLRTLPKAPDAPDAPETSNTLPFNFTSLEVHP